MSNVTQRIYVACLSSYNNGILYGKWIDVVDDHEFIQGEINKMLQSSPMNDADEFAIHDFEGFCGLKIEEYQSIDEVIELANFINEYGQLGAEVYIYYGNDLDDAKQALDDCYHGEYENEEEFALQLFEDCYEIPDYLTAYIDYKQVARDLFINDYLSIKVDHKIHVFSHH